MAKRIVKWTLDGSILKLHKYLNETSDVELQAEFNVIDIFPEFMGQTDVQKYLNINGIKQRLMDCGASEVGNADGKVVNAKKIWAELLAGKITGERVNATGSAENKRIVSEVKASSKVISLEGLMIKKIAFPATFTAEDQVKLDEFLAIKFQK
jgi:hypothetical protein